MIDVMVKQERVAGAGSKIKPCREPAERSIKAVLISRGIFLSIRQFFFSLSSFIY